MPRYQVKVTCAFDITLDANTKWEALAAVDNFVQWNEPTQEFIDDYNDDHETFIAEALLTDLAMEVENVDPV